MYLRWTDEDSKSAPLPTNSLQQHKKLYKQWLTSISVRNSTNWSKYLVLQTVIQTEKGFQAYITPLDTEKAVSYV